MKIRERAAITLTIMENFHRLMPRANTHHWDDLAKALGSEILGYTVTEPMGTIPKEVTFRINKEWTVTWVRKEEGT
jgi:hypothetical protein